MTPIHLIACPAHLNILAEHLCSIELTCTVPLCVIEVSAMMLMLTDGRALQPLAILLLGKICLESVVALPESCRTKRGAYRLTENSFWRD